MSEPQESPAGGRISLPNVSTAIRWLSDRGVKSSRLAAALGTNPDHIRVLRHRAQPLHFNAPAESIETLMARPASPIRRRLRVRPHEDTVVHSRRTSQRIDDLEHELDQVWETYGRPGEFSAGLERLRRYDSLPGYPASAKWLRFMARLHQDRAWFYSHSGMSTSAFQDAKTAMDLSQLAFHESEDPLDLRRLADASLIGSNACLLSRDPETSLKLLDIAASASARISDALGSEHYRQRGTAHFQMLAPEDSAEARIYFTKAMDAMERKQECRSQGQLLMAGDRHLALLGTPDMDRASAVLEQVRLDFAPSSLEYVLMLNWTAACALATDSAEIHSYAQRLLNESLVRSAPFGHQATRARLLALTTDVGLDRRFWKPWIYRALYENASRAS